MKLNVPVLYVDTLFDHVVASGTLPNGTRYKAIAGNMHRLRERVQADMHWDGYLSYALITTAVTPRLAPMTDKMLGQMDDAVDVSGGGSSTHSGAKGGGDHMTGHMGDKSTLPCDMYGNGEAAKGTMRPK